ncbi:DUF45 domain-containing protein [Endozoicomonas gorgoniicola]|uniref:DUF45 domain-containing protein n=1 Tax=Endozoicomonas gorgoniicola TaxID=1234144 RepID=A0ABT3MYT9_9GAMM|nr:YgjP-like metallopeptidase domain-containing protein [Endozoicomonas gorgoniicola]MCW7554536.1 DUF45 domain-containing protein [Endozoicomonas gorgoniicola]
MHGILHKLQSIEERVRAEIKDGGQPIAVPTDEIPKLVNDLFKKPYGDESQNDKHHTRVNNTGLLIVSDMLLTGWDAPIVNTLYLDKPLKEHTLLQAIARVNRTRKGKNAGYIVDYHGVVEYLDKALSIYGSEVQPEQIWTDINSELPKLETALQKVLNLLPKKHDPIKQPELYKEDADLHLDPDARLDVVLPDQRGARYQPYFKVLGEIKLALKDEFITGSRLLYRGKTWYCVVEPAEELSQARISFNHSRFFIQSPEGSHISNSVLRVAREAFFREKAKDKLLPRIRYWQRQTGLEATGYRMFKFQRRWASCSEDNVLEFHPRCMEFAPSVLDYVIVHELCHTIEKHHDKAFWVLVAKHYPDWERCHAEVDRLGVEV